MFVLCLSHFCLLLLVNFGAAFTKVPVCPRPKGTRLTLTMDVSTQELIRDLSVILAPTIIFATAISNRISDAIAASDKRMSEFYTASDKRMSEAYSASDKRMSEAYSASDKRFGDMLTSLKEVKYWEGTILDLKLQVLTESIQKNTDNIERNAESIRDFVAGVKAANGKDGISHS